MINPIRCFDLSCSLSIILQGLLDSIKGRLSITNFPRHRHKRFFDAIVFTNSSLAIALVLHLLEYEIIDILNNSLKFFMQIVKSCCGSKLVYANAHTRYRLLLLTQLSDTVRED